MWAPTYRSFIFISKKKIETWWPFLWMGFNCLKARATSRGQYIFYLPLSSQKFLVLILLTWKDERPRRPWKPPSGFEHETPGLGTQRLSWSTRVVFLKASELFSTFESVFFLKVWFFVQQKAWILWLWSVIILFKVKRKVRHAFAPRLPIFTLRLFVNWSSPKTKLQTNFLSLENRSLESVSFSQ